MDEVVNGSRLKGVTQSIFELGLQYIGDSLLQLRGTMQGHKRSKGMSKSETGLQSLGQGSQERVWNGEGQGGLGTWSSKNGIKVCGQNGYTVGVVE